MVFEVNVAVVKGFPPLGRSWPYFLVDSALSVPFGGMGQLGGPNSLRDRLFLEGRSGHRFAAKNPARGPMHAYMVLLKIMRFKPQVTCKREPQCLNLTR